MPPTTSTYKLTHQQAVQQLTMAMNSASQGHGHTQQQHHSLPVHSSATPTTPHPYPHHPHNPNPHIATNLTPLLQHAQYTAQQQVQQQLAYSHQQPPSYAHPTHPSQAAQAAHAPSAAAPGAPVAPPLPPPIPPMLDSLETEDGIYVDDQEFELAQSRVKRWLELDAEIATLSAALRERRKQREDLNKHLIAFMQGNHVPHFEMSKGNLSLQVSKHKQPLNQKWIESRILAVEGLSVETQQELVRRIFEERGVTEKPRLKHMKNRKAKS